MGQPNISRTRPFRTEDWWKSKASLLMGFVYLFALWFGIPMQRFIPLSFFSIAVIVGFASFGYLTNDFFDKEKDRLAGKKNFLLGKSPLYQSGLFLLSISFISLPWLYLPTATYSYVMIGGQMILFLVYSVPPLRLKERGVAGIIVDAMYAHALPVVLAAYTFLLASGHKFPRTGLLFLFLWQFACGVRNIILHQSEDIAADTVSRTKNFVATISDDSRQNILIFNLVFELVFCWIFFVSLTLEQNDIFVCLLLVVCFYILVFVKFKSMKQLLNSTWRYFPNNVYEKWLPALYLVLLSFVNLWFLLFLVGHIALFNFDFYRLMFVSARQGIRWMQPHVFTPSYDFALKYSSLFVNYLIYYALLLFGIDLKKENSSAIEYFKKNRRKN